MMKLYKFFMFTVFSLINCAPSSFLVNGMYIDSIKQIPRVFSAEKGDFYSYCPARTKKSYTNYLTSYDYCKAHGFSPDKDYLYYGFHNCLKQDTKRTYITDNSELPTEPKSILDSTSTYNGYRVLYLMLRNICLEWNKQERELENLTPQYVSHYIRQSLLNGEKIELRDGSIGLLFDNIVLIGRVKFPKFSYSYDETNKMVTFRFLNKETKEKMMIEITKSREAKKKYNIYCYDERWMVFDLSC